MTDALGNENQYGELSDNVGQDEGNNQEKNSSGDWESQAKYFQSEKDKLYSENQDLKKYEKIGKFLESRPDIVQNITEQVGDGGQPQTERITLDKDEFDPWEAYNDPSSKSYVFRKQEEQVTINQAVSEQVDQRVSGLQQQVGINQLQQELVKRGLNEEQIGSFMEFAKTPTNEYGVDGAIKMWQAMTDNNVQQDVQQEQQVAPNPFDMIRQNNTPPPQAGVLNGEQPKIKSGDDTFWDDVVKANRVGNKLP
mgnify:CR=1 FL=1